MTGNDPRTGPEDSGYVEVTAADGNAPQTAYSIPADALFRVEHIEWQYDDGSAAATEFSVYDDEDGTTNANVSDERTKVIDVASGGDSGTIEAEGRIFEEDVLIVTDGNQDDSLHVTVYGTKLTDLRDQVSY